MTTGISLYHDCFATSVSILSNSCPGCVQSNINHAELRALSSECKGDCLAIAWKIWPNGACAAHQQAHLAFESSHC
ncbi:hypothetical protein [Variovorax sp. 770b2]|uniref:hypothetical protein n=1 Tax=Variovorax sp. 770b2 TaxID=1566271 RepID=UPI0011601722|nr:hypothetical protein [Variovorax sp. 770b2]